MIEQHKISKKATWKSKIVKNKSKQGGSNFVVMFFSSKA